jgi:2'-5' RNA ligase
VSGLRRAFVAVVPPEPVADALAEAVARARASAEPGLRWLPRDQRHLTLRFLGRVVDAEQLRLCLRDAALHATGPIALGHAGAFASAARASVVWIGVRDGKRSIGALAASVEEAAVASGLPAEPRAFRPHVTLARARMAGPAHAALAALGDDPVGPPWAIGEVVLFESETKSTGAVHHVVDRFTVDGARG